jgi:hypothetical protein
MCNNQTRADYNAREALNDLDLAMQRAKIECARVREYHQNEYNRARHGW